jgi:adenosylmethionine-8-amino-7-oxononanoate aminotransferase
MGLLIGVEFVKDKTSREPFAPSQNIAERIHDAALEENVLTYPTQGCVDGLRGDHILLAPPFILKAEESAIIARAIKSAVGKVFPS